MKRSSLTSADQINAAGYKLFMHTARQLDVAVDDLAVQLGISARTMQRRTQSKSLVGAETMKAEMVSRIFEQATKVLGDQDKARIWMKADLPVLENRSPLELLTTIDGYERVRSVLGRIASGTF